MDISKIAFKVAFSPVDRVRVAAKIVKANLTFEMIGEAALGAMKSKYPKMKPTTTPIKNVGADLVQSAKDAGLKSDEDIEDVIQNALAYLAEKGMSKAPKTQQEYLHWAQRLVYQRAIDLKKSSSRKMKRREDGVDMDSLEGALPSSEDSASKSKLLEQIKESIGEIKTGMKPDEVAFLEFFIENDSGDVRPGIDQNMGQATDFRNWLESFVSPGYTEILQKNGKRWSAYVGELRARVLKAIDKYVDLDSGKKEFGILSQGNDL